jgi:hypothetical protein
MASLKQGDRVIGTVEIASFAPLNEHQRKFVEDAANLIAEKVSGN